MLTFKDYFLKEQITRKIVLFPGSFKPPHKGHVELIKRFKEMVGPEGIVNVIVTEPSPKSRRYTPDGKYIPGTVAADILKAYISAIGLRNVNVSTAKNAVGEVYDFIKDYATPGDQILVGVGGKGDDKARYNNIDKHTLEGVSVDVQVADVVSDEGGEVSASNFRNIIDNLSLENLRAFVPNELANNEEILKYVYSELSNLPSD